MVNPSTYTTPSTAVPLFTEWLADHSDGATNNEITLSLAEVVKAVAGLAKPGAVTIKIKVAPSGGGGRRVATAIEVDAKIPKPDPEIAIDYVGDMGVLYRDDPYQQRLDLQEVPRPIPFPDPED